MGGMVEEGALLWQPTDDVVRQANVTRYMEWLGRGERSYEGLWQWSVDDPAAFWGSVWDYFEVVGERGEGPVLAGEMPGARWFEGRRSTTRPTRCGPAIPPASP
jgi:acetoacetyl-CoA synthetase